ncbi:hypothetical protein [Azospirillum canadense]|uniref:hypothetical protein n=1 Tax=Azospirillum canadense TaxID=403962 RepID=UPI002227CC2E|nr:hypothetical protein [Azospirillum canadense]MCW2241616.1 hypothetical protein [Azospirillum canadense]
MPHPRRVVTMPLDQLWEDDGNGFGHRIRTLEPDDIKSMLREGPFRFVEASAGLPLRWTPIAACFMHWRKVRPNVVTRKTMLSLDELPGAYAYFASEWRGRDEERIVLLEMSH